MKSTTCQSNPAPALAMRTVTYCSEIKWTPKKTVFVRLNDAEQRSGLPIITFEKASAFSTWLARQPRSSTGTWLRFTKKGCLPASLTKQEAIDAALCHGWIDGKQDRYDATSWLIRFTPRRRASRWSQINRTRALELIDQGRMRHGGILEIEAARSDGRWNAAYAPASLAQVPADLQSVLVEQRKVVPNVQVKMSDALYLWPPIGR